MSVNAEGGGDDFAPLRSPGVSTREAGVLYRLGSGKTNPEVGIIIGTASATVKKHADNISSKLGSRAVPPRCCARPACWGIRGCD